MVRRITTNLANVELFGTCACVDTVSVPSHSPHRLASSISLQVLGQPFETISVTSGLYNTAHEHLERAFTLSHFFVVLAAGHVDAEDRLESFFWKRGGLVNLVSKDQERHVLQFLALQQLCQFGLSFVEAHGVGGVHDVHNTVGGTEIFRPQAASGHVTSQVMCGDDEASDLEDFRVGVQGRLVERNAVILQFSKESSFPGIVKTEEEDSALLFVEPEVSQEALEPVNEKHFSTKRTVSKANAKR
mmetsp:Transcript_26082/g.38593  ORF Transcript_26082/g.38593 Transcript_26082/m.38593 type:complete len:245 (+) Transcript_26082:523-1257(+)